MDGEGQDSRYFFHDFQRLYCIKLLTAASIVLAAGLQAALFFKAAATEKDWCLFLVPCADGALGWFSVVDRFVSGFLDVVAGACSAAEKDGRPNQPSESHSFPEANKAFSGPGRRRFLCGVFFIFCSLFGNVFRLSGLDRARSFANRILTSVTVP